MKKKNIAPKQSSSFWRITAGICLIMGAALALGAVPIKDIFWQGQSQNDANFGGHSITNLGSVTGTNAFTASRFNGSGAGLSANTVPGSALFVTNAPSATNSVYNFDGTNSYYSSGGTGGGSGTVTSVDVSVPGYTSGGAVTSSGTVTLTASNQTANYVLAGPTTGSAAAPSYRALVAADIPSLAASILSSGQVALARGGTGLDASATGGTGQVVKQSSSGAAFTVGTLPFSDLSSKPTTLSGYGIADGTPSSRTITATSPLTIGGGSSADLSANRTIALGTVPIVSGGTGQTSATAAFDAIAPSSPSNGDTITYNGTHWVKSTPTAAVAPSTAEVRLSLHNTLPISTSDINSGTTPNGQTVYLHAFHGGRISLYNGSTAWVQYTISSSSPLSLSLSGLSAGRNYDIWCYDNSGTPALDYTIWTDDTTRAVALALQDGIYVKTGSTTLRYVGTIRMVGTGQCEDSASRRFCWSMYNRVVRSLLCKEATASWSSGTVNTWREINSGSTIGTSRVVYVYGLSEDEVFAEYRGIFTVSSTQVVSASGIGIDSSSSSSAQIMTVGIAAAGVIGNPIGTYRGYPGIGYHVISALENNDGAGIFYGASSLFQTGMTVTTKQ